MSQPLCDSKSLVSVLSAFFGGASFASNLVATIPQLIETYQQKSVEGLSLVFVSIWVIGDITSLIGCFLTNQLFFQYVLALYFLFNDFILVGQYYYYGYYLKKHHHHHHHHHHHQHNEESTHYGSTNRKRSSGSLIGAAARAALPAVAVASNIGQSSAFPIGDFMTSTTSIGGFSIDSKTYGVFFAWFGAGLYFFSRIPQLIKNHQRKSTEDISPILFACTLFGNITYTASILVSCDFIYGENRLEFFINELPYIIGSAGTIVFDLFYFYQVWLYRDQSGIKDTETQPLLNSD